MNAQWQTHSDPGLAPDQHRPAGRPRARLVAAVSGIILAAGVVALVKAGATGLFAQSPGPPPGPVVATPTSAYQATPADSFAIGSDAIVLPAATAVPGFTMAEVGADLLVVKQALQASRLDPGMIVRHDPSALLQLIAPDDQAAVTRSFSEGGFSSFATQLAPDSPLSGDPIRGKGTVTFSGRMVQSVRQLQVVTTFVWVYPFAGPLRTPGDHLVVSHTTITWGFPAAADVVATSHGLWMLTSRGYSSNVDCGLASRGLLALRPSPQVPPPLKPTVTPSAAGPTDGPAAPVGPAATDDPAAPIEPAAQFDPAAPIDMPSSC